MQKPLASLVMAKDLFEVLRRTARESPGKSHDDVTKIVWVPYQAPPARNQKSSTTWSQNSFCICREIKKCKYSAETENGIKCELTERFPYEQKTSCSGEKLNGTVLSTGNFSEKSIPLPSIYQNYRNIIVQFVSLRYHAPWWNTWLISQNRYLVP